MNEQQRAVVQQALEALKGLYAITEIAQEDIDCRFAWAEMPDAKEAITALRKLLEQPEPVQEPVGKWMGKCIEWTENPYKFKKGQSIYTTPPAQPAAWVGLTDEQANLFINGRGEHGDDDYVEPTGDGFGLTDEDLVKLIRRVEAHHGIGVKP
jgi:hypothetical protein